MRFATIFAMALLACVWLLPTPPSNAVVSQIDGTIVPVASGAVLLEQVINAPSAGCPTCTGIEVTPIDATVDAHTFPQIFMPPPADSLGQRLVVFTDIQEEAGYENSFGWYNVGDPTRLFRIFSCHPYNHEPPDMEEVDFALEEALGNWDGGFIAFYIITPEGRPSGTRNCGDWEPMEDGGITNWFGYIYFTESEQNGDGDYVHNLVYSSKDNLNRFYFAFEDLYRGGDNDFTDFTIMVEGLTPPCVPEPEICDGVDNNCNGEIDEYPTVDEGGPCGEDTGECTFGVEVCVEGALVCQGGQGPTEELCDGKDNDCDGVIDNDPSDVGQVCGSDEGECEPGITICVSGGLVCDGEVGSSPEVCDGKDNDCNGLIDDNLGQTTCGLGICEHTIDNCVGGVPQVCDPLFGALPEECNDLDDDCNGVVDGLMRVCYPFATGCTDLGGGSWSCEGTCTTGLQECPAGGGGWGSCLFAQGPTNEVCDNADNNCDGNIDEGLFLPCYPLGYGIGTGCSAPGVCEGECREGTRTCTAGVWGACQSAITPTQEVCDNKDNDCNGLVDDNLTQACTRTNVHGTCTGVETCTTGSWSNCSAPEPAAELCNNVDDNCDGRIDEELSQPCYTGPTGTEGIGACKAGVEICTAGLWGACQGQVTPTEEVCDGVDNTCDGFVDRDDQGNPLTQSCYSGPLGTEGVGVCRAGVRTCTGGSWGPCVGEITPSAEQCNGLDDNCNDEIDENLGQTTCGLGICEQTIDNCVNGVPQVCDPYAGAQMEICDGLDNDCDGIVDGLVRSCYSFGDGCVEAPLGSWTCEGVCTTGFQICPAGGPGTWGDCLFEVGPTDEVCDGLDNNCNGLVDEDEQGDPLSQPCYPPGSGPSTGCVEDPPGEWTCLGICRPGQRLCENAAWSPCVGEITPTIEVCDGTDNDCDGLIDEPEDIPGLGFSCGTALGRCTPGILLCVDGQEICEGGEGPFPGECNGLDDNCNGAIDEADEVAHLEGLPCGDSTGICEPGLTLCVGGQIQCVGGVLPSEEVCDGLDNDCDGVIDNDAECPPFYWCVMADCRKECDPTSEFPCPGSLTCQQMDVGGGRMEHLCMPGGGSCGGETCPEGWICQNDQCVDPCDPNPCQWWEECNRGLCVDVSCTGFDNQCPQGEFCLNHSCVSDPCLDAACHPETEYCVRSCDSSTCTAHCETLCQCSGGERCRPDGLCEPDPCFDTTCAPGLHCDPSTGACVEDPCSAQICPSGQACFEGECIDDPCASLVCPEFYRCALRPASEEVGAPQPFCEADPAFWVPGTPVTEYLATGGGGCQCDATPGPGGAGPMLLAWILGFGLMMRRRKRARSQDGQEEEVVS